jgi:hypothetical protein
MEATFEKLAGLQAEIDAQGLAVRDIKTRNEDATEAVAKLIALKSAKDEVVKTAVEAQNAAIAVADAAAVEALTAQLASLEAMLPKEASGGKKKKKKEISPEEKAAADAKAAEKAAEKERKKAERKAKKAAAKKDPKGRCVY